MNTKISTAFSFMKQHCMKPMISLVMVAILFFNASSPLIVKAESVTDPLAYYKQIEKDSMNKNVDILTKAYSAYLSDYQKSSTQQVGVDTTLQATFDSSITDNTPFKGIKSIKANLITMVKGNNTKTNMKISCNDQELTSAEVYTLKDAYYYLIPDLSKAYLKMDLNSLGGDTSTALLQSSMDNFMKDPISGDVLNQLIKKYGNIVIDNVNNVTKKDNVDVTIDSVTSNYTRLDVTMNEKNVLDVSKAILDTAKEDTELINLCTKYGICSQKEYNKAISEGLADNAKELKALKKKKSNGKDVLKMSLWVNSQGEITGRSIKVIDSNKSLNLGYKTTKSGTKMGVEAWINTGDKENIKLTGSLSAGFTGISGDFKLTYKDSSHNTSGVINIGLKDIKYTKNDTSGFLTGECTITGTDFDGMSFNIKSSGDFGKQDMVFDILKNNKSVAVVSITAKIIPFTDFSLPSSSDTIYDINTQLDDYMKNANIKGYLEGIKQKTDVQCIDSFIDKILADYKNNTKLK